MVSKQELLESIVPDMTADEHFYKLVYSFYIDNPALLPVICEKLMAAGRKDIVQAYNVWCVEYRCKQEIMLKPIARMLSEKIDKEYDQMCKDYKNNVDREVNDWKQDKEILLKTKKALLLKKKSLLLMQK